MLFALRVFVSAYVVAATLGGSICSSYRDEGGAVLVVARLFGVCVADTPEPQPPQPLKIFVAGLSKTGTSSMKLALERLGYKVYHMSELVASPGQLATWKQAALMHRAGDRGNASAIFDALAVDGYNATTDLPMAFFWREALRRYPHAKFILTKRDTPEKYVRSWETMQRGAAHMVNGIFLLIPTLRDFLTVTNWWATLYPGLSPDEGRALALNFEPVRRLTMGRGGLAKLRDDLSRSYELHNEHVVRGIPSENILVFNVKQGFADGELCRFLNVTDCPATFPHSNENSIFRPLALVLLWIRFSWLWLPTLLTLRYYSSLDGRSIFSLAGLLLLLTLLVQALEAL